VIGDWCATEPSLGSLKLPVLLLAAEHDFITPRAKEGWDHLAQKRLEVMPEVGHQALL
jgi:pimeloyl-ACP methyl ester carboxylesterase